MGKESGRRPKKSGSTADSAFFVDKRLEDDLDASDKRAEWHVRETTVEANFYYSNGLWHRRKPAATEAEQARYIDYHGKLPESEAKAALGGAFTVKEAAAILGWTEGRTRQWLYDERLLVDEYVRRGEFYRAYDSLVSARKQSEAGSSAPIPPSLVKVRGKVSIGDRFGRLLVVSQSASHKKYGRQWSCRCDCGNVVVRRQDKLLSVDRGNRARSCGCLRAEERKAYGDRCRQYRK